MDSSFQHYPYPSTLNVANFVSIKFSKPNYLLWKAQMLCLMASQDLLGFIEGTTPPPPPADPNYLLWRRSDTLVKGWILGSLTKGVLATVVQDSNNTARDVWAKLEITLAPPPPPPPPSQQNAEQVQLGESTTTTQEEEDLSRYVPLYKFSLKGDWDEARRFFNDDNNAVQAKISSDFSTALHIAVGTGKSIHFVENLVQLMPEEALAQKNEKGETALALAAKVGNTEVAKILVNLKPDLLYIEDKSDFLPLRLAAGHAHKPTLLYLLRATKKFLGINKGSSPFEGKSGVSFVNDLIMAGFFDVALNVVKENPCLAMEERNGFSSLTTVAAKGRLAFLSGSCLNRWESLIYYCVPINLDNYSNNPNGGDVENPIANSDGQMQIGGHQIRFLIGNYFNSVCKKLHFVLWEVIKLLVPRVKHICQKKLDYHQALQLVEYLCKAIESLNDHKTKLRWTKKAVVQAAEKGACEVIEKIVEAFPEALFSVNRENHSIFHLAIIYRCENVFNLLYQIDDRKQLFMFRDNSGNTIWHLAGKLATPNKLNLVSGAALQMQRELQWFKEVEKFITPGFKDFKNKSGKTASMVFTKEHKNLVIEGEKWMKDTANSCTIVAALIATVVFAAAITVPGGNNGESGLPIFSKEIAFMVFGISDAFSLFTSITSLLMFLSILTARYEEQDFLFALPNRLIIGLITLFLSITSMMIAFSTTLYLVSGNRKAIITIPIIVVLASVPVTLFAFLQFPLLMDVISSTYGRGIFGKK